MKMPAFLSKVSELVLSPVFWLGRALASIWFAIFGHVSWSPPSWFSKGHSAWSGFSTSRPRTTASILIAALLITCGSIWSWKWYQNRPKPHRVSATISAIPVTKLDKELQYPPLVMRFSDPAARLEDLKKPSLTGVKIEPQIAGTWSWNSDKELTFRPSEDWPADRKYQITFDKQFFPSQVLMERLTYQTRTPAFSVGISQLELYQDPTNPKQRQVTATLELTHQVEPGELDKHIKLTMVGGSAVFPKSEQPPHFTLTYGLHRRLAYLRSSSVALPEKEDFMKLEVRSGVRTAQGGAETHDGVEQKISIPSLAAAFQISSIDGNIARNKSGEPEQVLILSTTADISTKDLAKAVKIWLLPKREVEKSEDEDSDSESADQSDSSSKDSGSSEDSDDTSESKKEGSKWESATDVPDEILEQAKSIQFTALPSEKAQDRQHAFRVRVESEGELYVRIAKGVKAFGDYPLAEDYNAVVAVPELPREVQIESQGGLLALNGERKLSIRSRGLNAIEYEIARVATTQINHLVSQSEGKFEDPEFKNPSLFNQENIARIAIEHQPIAVQDKWKANYSAFDFTEQLKKPADGGSERGLFFLTARGWDPDKKKPISGIKDSRFLLVTDIGILTKKGTDGSSDVFLVSIKTGKPIGGATVDILGKNGVPVQTAKTSADGHCTFSSVEKSEREKAPTAFVARNGDDIAFMPFASEDRVLNFSRFETEGAENIGPDGLDAFVFTERGVYRPGDEIHAGIIIKQRRWQGNLKGLPVETEVIDARDLKVQTKKVTLPDTGFVELSYLTANESPTGTYTINIYLIKDNKRGTLLGSTTTSVKEFLPDRMKLETQLSKAAPKGWISPNDVHATITLANLYGTPASDRRVAGKVELEPSAFSFSEFPDYTFFDPLIDEKKTRSSQTSDLGEQKTDNDGHADFDLQLERFADSTYSMRFIAEGFEGEGGRSVTSYVNALVSALPYVIGYKPDGDLRYIDMKKPRAVDLIAIDPQLNKIAVENVTLNVVAQEYVSVLKKQENGNYTYESVLRERPLKSEKIAVASTGLHYALPTNDPGDYLIELRDDKNRVVSKLRFSVVGQGQVSRSLEKNAELQIKLDKKQYNPGEDIAVSIIAPYGGSGLITIEREKVYAYAWFQTNTPSSIQHIRLPETFEGSGYINVSFVRALDSKEIFVSPLSYGVVPFAANVEKRRLKIELDSAATVKPGDALHIGYKTDKPSRIVVFAVDQGILQVTDYKTPKPLEYFFRKCALGVETAQIVDLIIPEFSLLRSLSAFGGGEGEAPRLNPFKRVTEKPVVFWSGILDADSNRREVVYNVPDFFDGTLKIMAVAVASDTTGASDRDSLIRGPFVVTPSVPVLAVPNDEFEAGVTVANNVEGSGADAEIELRAETSPQLSVKGQATQKMQIAEGREKSAVFRFHVNEVLGSGEIRFIASRNGIETKRRATLSVRPAVPFVTDVRSASFKKASVDVPIKRQIYNEFAKRDAALSATPLGLAHGLDSYLKSFPFGCSEQVTSGAFCRLVLSTESDFGLSRGEVNAQMERTFSILRRRQNAQGAFGYWAPENGEHISFNSAYVMDFLSEAKVAGFPPPAEMFSTGLRSLQRMVAKQPSDLIDARRIAYAIYVLTREGVITTNYILNLQDYLKKKNEGEWENDLTGVYLAGSLKLLHKDKDAETLIDKFKLDNKSERTYEDFCQPLGTNAQYVTVLARQFPARLKKISATQFEQILKPIGDGQFNTLSAAYAVQALTAYSHVVAQNPPQLTIAEVHRDRREVSLVSAAKLLQRAQFSKDATALRFKSAPLMTGPGAFYQVVEAGYDRRLPEKAMSEGLEIFRELLDKDDKPITRTKLGEPVHVRLRVRSTKSDETFTNVAVVDLLPGGFEVVGSSLQPGVSSINGVDYVDVREDRAIFFGTATENVLEINYQIKSTNRGEFVVPPVFAESMYERNIKGRGVGGKITVTE
ncbi:MAG TPA: alpha-2-macroglobulin [Chthoniobacterales bacterium]|nr:alpha-2-macroglobulin [Chthoniobacterales bacterium]